MRPQSSRRPDSHTWASVGVENIALLKGQFVLISHFIFISCITIASLKKNIFKNLEVDIVDQFFSELFLETLKPQGGILQNPGTGSVTHQPVEKNLKCNFRRSASSSASVGGKLFFFRNEKCWRIFYWMLTLVHLLPPEAKMLGFHYGPHVDALPAPAVAALLPFRWSWGITEGDSCVIVGCVQVSPSAAALKQPPRH